MSLRTASLNNVQMGSPISLVESGWVNALVSISVQKRNLMSEVVIPIELESCDEARELTDSGLFPPSWILLISTLNARIAKNASLAGSGI